MQLEPAFVLHTRAYRNTSLLLEVLTRSQGRLGLVARGVRRQRSQTAALLQPFRPLAMAWRLRGELGSLHQVEPAGQPLVLSGRALISGFYLNELLVRLLGRGDPQQGLLEAYWIALARLADSEFDEAVALRTFERDFLEILGYGLPLAREVGGASLVPAQWYRYDPQRGAEPVAGPSAAGLVVAGSTLIGLAAEEMTAEVARASRQLMRAALKPHLGPKPLKTRELYARFPAKGAIEHGASSRLS